VIDDRRGIGQADIRDVQKTSPRTPVRVRFQETGESVLVEWRQVRPLLSGRQLARQLTKILGRPYQTLRGQIEDCVPYDHATGNAYWYDEANIPQIVGFLRALNTAGGPAGPKSIRSMAPGSSGKRRAPTSKKA